MAVPLVIDTDTAADDCFALLVGLLHPNADLRAITIVGGNVGFDQQVHNAFLTLERAGRAGDVPVHVGAATPLEREWVGAEEVHGDGVGGLRRSGRDEPSDEAAADALLRLSHELEGELTLVCIGPLTNIATALRRDPGLAARVREVIVMGGSVNGRGNITPVAEYNVYVDPEAADIVLQAGFKRLRWVPWFPTTLQDAVFDLDHIAQLASLGTTLSTFFVRANEATFGFDMAAGIGGSSHPDTTAVLCAVQEGFVVQERQYRVAVETRSDLTRGVTVFDAEAGEVAPNGTAVERVDGAMLFEVFKGILASR